MQHELPADEAAFSRRTFVKTSAIAAGSVLLGQAAYAQVPAGDKQTQKLRVALVGCGNRGTGAIANVFEADPNVELVALGDLFEDRVKQACEQFKNEPRFQVKEDHCFTGFDNYLRVCESDADIIMLASPPGFRPLHYKTAIEAGKHVFMEKPVAVDPTGIRMVLEASRIADEKKLSVVAGTQRRHQRSYQATIEQIQKGAIGKVISASCYWNMGGLWCHERQPGESEMEWQIRNWLYFTWLSGDHMVEQHVHNLDAVNWVMGAHPVKALGMGGRQVRTDPKFGSIFDHFAIEFTYPGGERLMSMCRQIDGCASKVTEEIAGAEGKCSLGESYIEGKTEWEFEGESPNPYMQEQADLIAAIRSGVPVNEGQTVAESTLTAIMGRMSAYTGQEVTWEQALNSKLDLFPTTLAFGDYPVAPVAMPGTTPLI